MGGAGYALHALNRYALTPAVPDTYDWSSDFAGNSWSFTSADGGATAWRRQRCRFLAAVTMQRCPT